MSDLTPREHALKVAVLSTLLDTVKAEYQRARKDAEQAFATVRKDGSKQQAVMLPDGSEIGLISIRGGSPSLTLEERVLLAWVREHVPDDIEEYVEPGAWAHADIIEMVKACFPNTVRERVRPAAREALIKQMTDSGGFVVDEASGETEKLGNVEHHDPTGAFSYRAAKGAQDKIITEWMAGKLREIALGPLALPDGEATA